MSRAHVASHARGLRATRTRHVALPGRGPRLSRRARGGRRVAGRGLRARDAATTSWSPAARCRRTCWCSRCCRRGSARAACSAAPGSAIASGSPALWQSAGAWVGIALIFFIAPRVRRLAQYTVPDILEMRYGPPARVLGTITIVLAYTAIAAYQFRGGGRLLNLVAGIDPGHRRGHHRGVLRRLHRARRHALGRAARRRQRRDDARRRRRGDRLPARAAPAASAPPLASLRPDQLTRVRLAVAGPGAGAVPADDVPAARRSEHVSEVLLGARRARGAQRRRRLDRRHHRRRDADHRASACSAASPSPGSAPRNRRPSSSASPSTCCRRCSACCCSPAPRRSSSRPPTACCSPRRPTWCATSTSAS